MLEIEFLENVKVTRDVEILFPEIQKVLEMALESSAKNKGNNEVSIVFVNDVMMQQTNLLYRGIDKATDVISFAFDDVDDAIDYTDFPDMPHLLGEIIVSLDKAIMQAQEYGHSFERELLFLILHGFLHLLGYDHQNKAEELQMFGLQEKILTAFKFTK